MTGAKRRKTRKPDPAADPVAAPQASAPEPATAPKTSVPVHKIPAGFDRALARELLIDFTFFRRYRAGSLVLFSSTPLPQFNSADDVMVVDDRIGEQLDRQGVTGPIA